MIWLTIHSEVQQKKRKSKRRRRKQFFPFPQLLSTRKLSFSVQEKEQKKSE